MLCPPFQVRFSNHFSSSTGKLGARTRKDRSVDEIKENQKVGDGVNANALRETESDRHPAGDSEKKIDIKSSKKKEEFEPTCPRSPRLLGC